MTGLNSFTRRLALMIAALMLTVSFSSVAVAQDEPVTLAAALSEIAPDDDTGLASNLNVMRRFKVSRAWISNIDQQFAHALHSPIDEVRGRTLKNIIYVATFHSDLVLLKAAVPSLVDVYRLDDVEAHRLMAVQALYAIGDGYGMQRLREEAMSQPSARVRTATKAALIEYEAAQ
ncbi:MAG TPA: hypothetical protein VKP65_13205 [Rhodothermales bacterium]|nr:hypothetical protein [Rhodothermales bacterium]